VNVKKRNQL